MSNRIEALSDHDEELFSQGGCWDLAIELEKTGFEFAVLQDFVYDEYSYPHAFAIDGDTAVDVFGRIPVAKMVEKWSKLLGREVKVLKGQDAWNAVSVRGNPSLAEKAKRLIEENKKFFLGSKPVHAASKTFLPERLVMLDCEMTGVDESKYELLQAAFVKLELDGEQFREVGEPLVLYFKHEGQPQNNFHKKFLSHIFKACNESELTGPQGQELLHEWLDDWLGEVMPTGDCVPTDIAFLKQNGVVKRNDIVDDEQVPGTFHYEYWEMNPLKDISRHIKGEKYAVADLDEEGIHDGLVDCRNQTKELNAALAILLSGRAQPAAVSAVLVMAGEILTPEEAKKSYDSQESVAERGLGQFENFEWKHAKTFPLDQLSVNGGEPISKPMWTEGYNRPSMPWNSERDAQIENTSPRDRTPEDEKFRESWRDESVAEQYARLTTKAPPIFIIWDEGQHRFRFWNGRHRSRAAWLRGERTIDAIVGQPRPIQEMFSTEEWDRIHAAPDFEIESRLVPFEQVQQEILDNELYLKTGATYNKWLVGTHNYCKPPALIATARYAEELVGWAGVGIYISMDKHGSYYKEPFGDLNCFVKEEYRQQGLAQILSKKALEGFKKEHPEIEEVYWNEGFTKGEDLIEDVGLLPVQMLVETKGAVVAISKRNNRRIKSTDAITPEELPVAVQPKEGDDGILPEDKKQIVESFNTKSLRCDSFQDFQELLNQIMLAAELIEDYRPSVAGILNEHRVAEGYVAL